MAGDLLFVSHACERVSHSCPAGEVPHFLGMLSP